MPSGPDRWLVRFQQLSTQHVAWSEYSLSLSSGKLHWQFPDSSTEDRFLRVLKNNVSDTRGTELLLQEISLGFSLGFPI